MFSYILLVCNGTEATEREKMEIILRFAKHFILSDIPNYSATSQLLPPQPQKQLIETAKKFLKLTITI